MDTDLLDSFNKSLSKFFQSHGLQLTEYSIKMSDGNNDYDISVYLHSSASSFPDTCVEELRHREWDLPVLKITVQENRCNITLNRPATITKVIKAVHDDFNSFGTCNAVENKTVSLKYDVHSSTEDLTNYRIALLVHIVKNLCQAVGYSIAENELDDGLYFTNKSNLPEEMKSGRKLVLCGSVLNSHQKTKETAVSVTQYRNMKKRILLREVEDRVTEETTLSLADAMIKFDLVRVKVNSPVILDVTNSDSSSAGTVVFILYNYSRLNAILHEYETRVSKKLYPALPPVSSVDFSLLKEKKEWKILFNFILKFSTVISSTVQDIGEGKPSPHLLAQFLYSLARTTSSYYRSIKILLEAESQRPLMFARLYLIKTVHKMLSHGLKLLSIQVIPAL